MALKQNLVAIFSLFGLLNWNLVPQFKQGYYCNDPIISHKYTGDTFPLAILMYISFLGPLFTIAIVESLRQTSFRQTSIRTVLRFYVDYLAVMWIVLLMTEVVKLIFREHRPHFLHSCAPDTGVSCEHGEFVTSFTCTSSEFNEKFKDDSSKSFPSGHSSVSVLTALFSAVFVYWRYPETKPASLKLFLVVLCLSWGVACPISRIYDRRHHWWDVVAGAVLGAIGAWYALTLTRRNINRVNEKSVS